MAPHSSILAWKIPWMVEPGRLQSMGSLRVRHDWVTSLSLFTFIHWRRQWQPTPVFLPGESQGWRSLVGCHLWGLTESDRTEATCSSSSGTYPGHTLLCSFVSPRRGLQPSLLLSIETISLPRPFHDEQFDVIKKPNPCHPTLPIFAVPMNRPACPLPLFLLLKHQNLGNMTASFFFFYYKVIQLHRLIQN